MHRTLRVLAALAGALLATAALASDPPHDMTENPKGCEGCHVGHNTLGSALTKKDTNANLCASCHGLVSDTDGKHFGFPWLEDVKNGQGEVVTRGDQAVPGTSGFSHRWDASLTSRGANAPSNPNLASHLDGTFIMCSTCHDQHNNLAGANTGTQHIGGNTGTGTVAVGSDWAPNGPAAGSGTGHLKLEVVTATAAPRSYRVRVSGIAGSSITYNVSHDAGGTWPAGGTATAQGGAVDLDDGANVRVSFLSAASLYAVGDYWDFWISYPMLQMANGDGAMCVQCHQDRDMRWQDVEGGNAASPPVAGGAQSVVLGTTYFSHPVGQALNSNTKSIDRTAETIADVNGQPQSTSADTNKTNDLKLGTGGVVTCMSCHWVHNADSNSATVDPR